MLTMLLQLLLFALWAPLVNGVIKATKARLQRRVGPPIWQPYRDLMKLFRKQMVISGSATWLFHGAPYVHAGATAAAALLVPSVPALQRGGDFLLLIGMLALSRFVLALAALEPGSAFGGMGSSREMAVSAFVEPALLVTLGAFIVIGTGSGPGRLLAAAALVIITVAETGRVPVDNPDTHLELTMIHEGMVLEYSGPYLGLIAWSHDVKQLIMLTLLANLALPVGLFGQIWLALPVYLVKTLLLGVLLAFIETGMAKVRILKIPDLLITATALSALAALSGLPLGR
ncbi:MAG TPA: NADH-quinone oxidoreductase subunit H [Symbiobacteriaceae bacterium]|nr:NADH-quinone oxidoreductase subunit H [Symbiobacteriaceae bacterium]